MSVLKFVEEIEEKYNVNSVVYKNAQLWPYFRIYLSHHKIGSKKTEASKKVIITALRNLFYGFKNYFKTVDYIIFSNTEQRKLLNNKYYDRFDFLPEKYRKNLFFELTQDKFYKLNQIPTKNIVSKIPLYILAKFIEIFVTIKQIENTKLFHTITNDHNLTLNTNALLKSYIAQYKVAKLIIKIYKPKALILITSYTNYAYIHAFKDAGINVIEFQHGLINDRHLAYNFRLPSDKNLFPDYLFTLGEFERNFFTSDNNFIHKKNVIPVGHFYIDYLKNNYKPNKDLQKRLNPFKKSVAITLQYQWEEKLISFIEEVASKMPNYAFIIIPRHKNNFTFNTENIFMYNSLNCYEIILNCDAHSTIFSTCATESLGLDKPNILVNIDNQVQKNLDFLLSNSLSYKANTVDEFIHYFENINHISVAETSTNIFFNDNFIENINLELNKLTNS